MISELIIIAFITYQAMKWKRTAIQEHNEKMDLIHNNERIATQYSQEKEARKKEQENFSHKIQELIKDNNSLIETIKQLSKVKR
jgi:hypothetical protein